MTTEPTGADTGATTRRALFAGAGAIGVGALLAACGGDEDTPSGTGSTSDGPEPGGTGTPGDAPQTSPAGEGDPPADALAEVGEVEVGGGVINEAAGVVVTQPQQGEFRGFSATCTHEGCIVSNITGGEIVCACHGSRYAVADGSVVASAPELTVDTQDPLPAIDVTVEGNAIVRA